MEPTKPWRARCAVALSASAVAVLLVAAPLAAPSAAAPGGAPAQQRTALPLVPVEPGPSDGTTSFVPAATTSSLRTLPRLSDIRVTYHGFPSGAKSAFEYATVLWERLVKSPVPIRVDATWTPIPGTALARAAANGAVSNFPGAPRSNVGYPMALADALAGEDLYPTMTDIVAEVDSDSPWDVGTDGGTDTSHYDLVSAALHELGHGLGFADSFFVAGGVGTWGLSSGIPLAFDRLIADSGGTPLIDYGKNSALLASKMTSNGVRFIGATAASRSSGPVRIYSPSTYQEGSSIGHLDESTYPKGTSNSLMTPQISPGEVIFDPGDITLGALKDIGWTITSSRATTPGAPAIEHVAAGNGKVWVHWTAPANDGRSRIAAYAVYRYKDGSPSAEPGTTNAPGTAREVAVSGLQNGSTYRFKVVAVNAVGASAGSATSGAAKPFDTSPFLNVDDFLLRQYADILHRGPSAATLTARRTALNTGAITLAATIVELMGDAAHEGAVPPAVRLYQAYFKRLPDTSGLTYWSGKLRSGTSLTKVSEQFARSSEFQHTYGSLGNGAFVDLVYQNVLGRAPDPSGRAHWLAKLNGGYPRGSVMVAFSESSENVRKTQHRVDAVSVRFALLQRVPTAGELAIDEAALAGSISVTSFVAQLLATGEYAARL